MLDRIKAALPSVNEGVPFVHRSVDAGDKSADIIVKVIDNAVSAFLKFRNHAANRAFERAIAVLAEAGRAGARIDFYGVGNSGIVAQDAQHKFFRLGVRATARTRSCWPSTTLTIPSATARWCRACCTCW